MNARRLFWISLSPLALLLPLESTATGAPDQPIEYAGVSQRDGFLEPIRRRSTLDGRVDARFALTCAPVAAQARLTCPPTLTDAVTARNFLPPPVITADLPHLRLDIVLKRMEHQAVSGGGVSADPDDLSDDLWATWKLQSVAATDSIPDPAADPFGLPVPQNPGEVWDDINHANALYQGIIANGCGAQTVFDVELESTVMRINGITLGAVHLFDQVVGTGFHTFSYAIRATDADGGVSDFIFSGDARAYCTGKSAF